MTVSCVAVSLIRRYQKPSSRLPALPPPQGTPSSQRHARSQSNRTEFLRFEPGVLRPRDWCPIERRQLGVGIAWVSFSRCVGPLIAVDDRAVRLNLSRRHSHSIPPPRSRLVFECLESGHCNFPFSAHWLARKTATSDSPACPASARTPWPAQSLNVC